MPYKHIAAHLKKTELACRLHYHQLSQGSNRRRRNTSISSISSISSFSSNGHSPIMSANIPSPVHEHMPGRSLSPMGSSGTCSYGHPASPGGGVQLPSIMDAGVTSNTSPRLPAILPKPASMSMTPSPARYGAPLLPPATFSHSHSHTISTSTSSSMPPLRIDCSGPPPPAAAAPSSSAGAAQPPVDMTRLHAVYSAHRGGVWSAIAADYGGNVPACVLEEAWRTMMTTTTGNPSSGGNGYTVAHTPISPMGNHDDGRDAVYGGGGGGSSSSNRYHQDRTRISAILGIDANPMSPQDREMVRRMEEGRGIMVGVGA